MAEIGLAASVIAVIQITTSVGQQVYKYGKSVKSAKEDVARIQSQLDDVGNVLQKLKAVAERAVGEGKPLDSWPTLVSLQSPDGALETCRRAILRLQEELKPVEGTLKQAKERARWPFKKKKVDQLIQDIKVQKKSLTDALGIEQMDQSLTSGHIISEMSKLQIEDMKRDVIKWLSHTDPDSSQAAATKLHSEGTGKWFTESDEYRRWKIEPNSFLWLYGIAGCGKTILCSEIIQQTRQYCEEQPADRFIVYFYFSFRDAKKQKVINLLRAILSQLVRHVETIPPLVTALFEDYYHCQPAPDRLLAAIHSIIDDGKEIFIIVDALDECPNSSTERDELCDILKSMKGWEQSKLHILVTSRKEVDLTETLNNLSTVDPVSIQGEVVKSDIERFMEDQLSQNPKLRKWPLDLHAEIKSTLVDGAQGMFRWVYCQIESLTFCVTPSDVRRALKSLPRTLDDTYDRMLMSIPEEHRQRAFIALQWISYAVVSVSAEELAEALLIDPTANPVFDPSDRPSESGWILEMLSSLVVVSTKKRYWFCEVLGEVTPILSLEIAHFSVTEYLESNRILSHSSRIFHMSRSSAIEVIIERSILYLQYYSRSDKKSETSQDFSTFPLLRYASEFWDLDVPSIDDFASFSVELKNLIFKFLSCETSLSSWLSVYKPEMDWKPPFDADHYEVGSVIYYAVGLGSCSLVQHFIDNGADVHAKGGYQHTGLQIAASRGNESMIKLLLENGVDINTQGGQDVTALQAAASRGNKDIVNLLLEKGADINVQGGQFSTPLQNVVLAGSKSTVKLLIELGADVNIQGGYYGSALQAAASCGDESIVKFLLKADADVNIQGGYFHTALQAAAFSGNKYCVKLLLGAGADVNIRGGYYGTALHIAALRGRTGVVKLLLKAGANVNLQGGRYSTALQAAFVESCGKKIRIVELLLAAGADTKVLNEEQIAELQEMKSERLLHNRSDAEHLELGSVSEETG